jgi:hypothetical protein
MAEPMSDLNTNAHIVAMWAPPALAGHDRLTEKYRIFQPRSAAT